MKSDALSQFPFLWLTCSALILFCLLFIAAVIWVFRSGSTPFYAYVESIPLQEEKPL